MNKLNDRRNAFENKFASDEEKAFKIRVKANKLLALWAADELKLSDAEKDAYAKEVLHISITNKDSDPILNYIQNSLSKTGKDFSRHYLERLLKEKFEDCHEKQH